jgi:pimeloyl-ACP methyl ester carboxylesterase
MKRLLVLSIIAQAFGVGATVWQPVMAAEGLRQLAGKWNVALATNGEAKLRVFTAGDGPTIVMLPARGLGPFELEPVAQRLVAAGFRVVLPEPRGCGESIGPLSGATMSDLASDVARAIETAGGAPVIVAGHAFGNRVGRMLAQDRPGPGPY